ncbi:MAG: tetratricopeptide repeat protein, partial [Longimicrobiales bacterium]
SSCKMKGRRTEVLPLDGRMPDLGSRVSTLIHELRRRHVFRVVVVYGAVSWLVAQMTALVQPALDLPSWTTTLVLVLATAGFPFAVVLAWAYDITPAGVERTPEAPPTTASQVALIDRPPRSFKADGAAARSIAALPFVNLSREPADEYFSDGLTEELINALTRVQGLRVAARTSAFAFKNSDLDVRQIGERLQVDHILEGSVRTAGNKLRMSVKLIDVDDGYSLWSETFDREMGDVFAVQEEIAREVVQRVMSAQLVPAARVSSPRTQPQLGAVTDAAYTERHPVDNVEAFQLYLKGRYFWNRRAEPDLRRAIESFQQAIQADPEYALAHAGLADTYAILLDHGLVSPQEALPKLTRSAERALQLAPSLAEAHTSLALARQFEWQWAETEAGFRQALTLNPDYPVANHRYALFLAWMNRADEATRRIEAARRVDAVSLVIQSSMGWIRYYGRRFDEALIELRTAFEMDPHFTNAHIAHALVLAALGRPDDSVGELQAVIRSAGPTTPNLALLSYALGAAGRKDEARTTLDTLANHGAQEYVSSYYRALPYLGMGDHDNALDWLDRAFRERAAGMIYINTDPIWDPVRSDARFESIIGAMRFV